MNILMKDLVLLNNSCIWCLVNKKDKRILITYSSNGIFGINDKLRKLYYKNIRQSPQLIKDYWDNLLEVGIIEVIQIKEKGDVIAEVMKQNYIQEYLNNGFSLYNKRNANKLFVKNSVVTQLSIDNHTEETLVYVVIAPKQEHPNIMKHKIIGVFDNMKDAKIFTKEFYPDVNKGIDVIITCNNYYTKRCYTSPLFQDKHLLNSYKKLFRS